MATSGLQQHAFTGFKREVLKQTLPLWVKT